MFVLRLGIRHDLACLSEPCGPPHDLQATANEQDIIIQFHPLILYMKTT